MFKTAPWPKGPYSIIAGDDGMVSVVDKHGQPVVGQVGGAERLVACANALESVWFPEAHICELEQRCDRLESLRAAAWAEILELRNILCAKSKGPQK